MDDRKDTLRDLVERSLAEDAARSDVTTAALVAAGIVVSAVITAKAEGVVSGHRAAAEVFSALDRGVRYERAADDGARVEPGGAVAAITGTCAAILSGERTALNFLQHLSGVATMTARFTAKVAGTGVVILDTRKTLPGLRALEKEAVVCGGGRNHRFDLCERILVKENHITAAGGLERVIERLGADRLAGAEIEVRSPGELRMLRGSPPARVMLDNFAPEEVTEAIAEVSGWGEKRPEIEVSGGVTLENVSRYARRGVDFLSIGSLTASAPALDLSLVVREVMRGDG